MRLWLCSMPCMPCLQGFLLQAILSNDMSAGRCTAADTAPFLQEEEASHLQGVCNGLQWLYQSLLLQLSSLTLCLQVMLHNDSFNKREVRQACTNLARAGMCDALLAHND